VREAARAPLLGCKGVHFPYILPTKYGLYREHAHPCLVVTPPTHHTHTGLQPPHARTVSCRNRTPMHTSAASLAVPSTCTRQAGGASVRAAGGGGRGAGQAGRQARGPCPHFEGQAAGTLDHKDGQRIHAKASARCNLQAGQGAVTRVGADGRHCPCTFSCLLVHFSAVTAPSFWCSASLLPLLSSRFLLCLPFALRFLLWGPVCSLLLVAAPAVVTPLSLPCTCI
jgi:hypothetical protein